MNLTLDAFVVMPNHFHAIIIIGDNQYYSFADNGHIERMNRDYERKKNEMIRPADSLRG